MPHGIISSVNYHVLFSRKLRCFWMPDWSAKVQPSVVNVSPTLETLFQSAVDCWTWGISSGTTFFVPTIRQKMVKLSNVLLWYNFNVLYSPHLCWVGVAELNDWLCSIDIHYPWNLVCSTSWQRWLFKDKDIAAMDGEVVGLSCQLWWGSMGYLGLFNIPLYLPGQCLLFVSPTFRIYTGWCWSLDWGSKMSPCVISSLLFSFCPETRTIQDAVDRGSKMPPGIISSVAISSHN